MDTTPIYDLRERLRAAAMAGTSLLSEDSRLRRDYEAFRPLEGASPVFAKIGQLTGQLLSPACQNLSGALLDTISLVDAVVCTLGTVEAAPADAALEDILNEQDTAFADSLNMTDMANTSSASSLNVSDSGIINIPYSTLKELLEALTTSGGGRYTTVCDLRENHSELFGDYRVRYAMVQALGASYTELADNVAQWMKEDKDLSVLPVLYRDFDPKGKKEMVRRVEVIDALAGAAANDFYIRMLDGAQKEIRQALIFALRHKQENVSLLLDMIKTEKGKSKDTVYMALANIEDERAAACLKQAAEKQPETVLQYLINASSAWSAELVGTICDKILERFDRAGDIASMEKEQMNQIAIPYDLVRAMFGKSGPAIRKCYQKLLKRKERINCFLDRWRKTNPYTWRCDIVSNNLWMWSKQDPISFERGLDKILQQSLVVNPDAALRALAMELYEKGTDNDFLSAAVMVKLIEDEDCVEWLETQIATARYPAQCMEIVTDTAAYIQWDKTRNQYILHGRPIQLTYADKIIKWFLRHETNLSVQLVMLWLQPDNKEMCREIGEYFYDKALHNVRNDRVYLGCLKKCGWTDCKGLGVQFVKTHLKKLDTSFTSTYLLDLPGDAAAIEAEYKAICSLIDAGRIKVDAKAYESFKQRMQREKNF